MNKKIIGLIIVSLCLGVAGLFLPVAKIADKVFGVADLTTITNRFKFSHEVDFNGVSELWKTVAIGAGTSTAYYKNTTPGRVTVDFLAMQSTGTASSSYKIYAFATTTTNPPTQHLYTNPTATWNRSLLAGILIATSTAATSTNSVKLANYTNTNSAGTIDLEVGESLQFFLLNSSGVANVPLPTCNGDSCEAATSTNRGFNLNFQLHLFATTTTGFPDSSL